MPPAAVAITLRHYLEYLVEQHAVHTKNALDPVRQNVYPLPKEMSNFCETKSMMKYSFITVLSLLVLCCTALGQTPNVQTIKIEAPEIVGEVNGDKISRSSLADECLQLHGQDELQELINKTLIRLECERQKITITADEINAEIIRKAETFKMDSKEYLELLEKQRGITPEQYRQDIIWRILALSKLAGQRLSISEAELQIEYEKNYGAAVQVRQIVLATKAEAEAALTEVKKHPETFGSIAKNRSIDPVSQPFGGMLHPIRRHSYNPNIEALLFSMKPGDISPVVEFPMGHFTIFLCEGHLEPRSDVDPADVKMQLAFRIRKDKLPQIGNEIFTELKKRAKVQIVFDNPVLYQQYPGVAAVLDGQMIPQQTLADACVQKHGKAVLGDMINRLIVAQACRRENITISEQDIDNEIREMAFKYLPLLSDGTADINLWYKRATEDSGLSIPMYRKNIVVPVLSLKRLTRKMVEVREEDVQRSYEANYGQKVRCLAIFFEASNQRRAMEVWNMANRFKTEESFGDLAAQYSYDPESRLNRGVIPPIAKHCGHPTLEKAAFALQPNELSELIHVEDSFVILYCLGHVDPLPVKLEDVKVDLVADIFEKKQQMIISRYFDHLHDQAVFENYLTGVEQNPAASKEAMREEENLQR